MRREKSTQKCCLENLKGRDSFEGLSENGRAMLERILMK
jgi:hypothetical protein